MRSPVPFLVVASASVALLAGCGGSDLPPTPTKATWSTASESPSSSASPTTTTTSAVPTTAEIAEPDVLPVRRPTAVRRPPVTTTPLRLVAPPPTTTATRTTTTTTRTTTAPTTTKKPSGGGFRSCKEAKAAGAAPLRRGEPGYSAKLDKDGDGVACER